ncbi:MAG: ATP-binding protein [Syntrophales bacterium]|nr:ATP-binding protein [Syntrophales bacterium]
MSIGTSWAAAKERVVRVGVYDNAPKIFISPAGKPEGIFIDLITFIAERERWTIQYIPGTWKEGLDRLATGEIDLMPDVAYTAEREKRFSFHKVPALSSWDQLYGRKESGIQSVLDLSGKKIVVLEGSVQEAEFKRMVESFGLPMTLIRVADYKQGFAMVSRGEGDAVVTNKFYGALHARNYGLEDTAIVFNPSALYFAAPKGKHEDLLAAIDKHLTPLKQDPQSAYYRALKRWTAEEVRFKLPLWVQAVGLVLGVVLLMSVVGRVTLKRQVDARTQELRRINAEMEQRIVERTAELAAAMEKAQAADRLKSAFLATMSHELRTPLNSIIGFTGIILGGHVGPLNEEQRKQLGMVRSSSLHLLALINDVLDLSKIEAGQLTLAEEDVELPGVIEKVRQTIQPLAQGKGLTLETRIAPDIGTIRADRRRLEQILLNLLNNAVKFTEKGSITVVCAQDERDVIFQVIDTGIGIREEDQETVFLPFRQIDSGISRRYEGTGLGLSITKRLVELMGGKIWVTSRLGAGSTFAFSLPRGKTNAKNG